MTQPPHDKPTAESPEELRAQVEHTRHELGTTVEALAAKADVKTRAQEKAAEVKVQAADRAGALKEQVAHKTQRDRRRRTGVDPAVIFYVRRSRHHVLRRSPTRVTSDAAVCGSREAWSGARQSAMSRCRPSSREGCSRSGALPRA